MGFCLFGFWGERGGVGWDFGGFGVFITQLSYLHFLMSKHKFSEGGQNSTCLVKDNGDD